MSLRPLMNVGAYVTVIAAECLRRATSTTEEAERHYPTQKSGRSHEHRLTVCTTIKQTPT